MNINNALDSLLRNASRQPPFNIIFQSDETECGLASLVMVLNIFGKDITIEKIRNDYGSTRGGMSIGELRKLSILYGLLALPAKGNLIKNDKCPVIIFAHGDHFAVLWETKNNQYFIADPADGNLVLSQSEFDDYYSGIYIEFKTTSKFQITEAKNISREQYSTPSLSTLLYNNKTINRLIILFAFVAAFFTLFNAAIQDVFMTYVVEEGLTLWTKGMISITIIVSIGLALATFMMQIAAQRQLQNSLQGWNIELFSSLFRAPYQFFINKTSGLIVSRFNQLEESFTGYQSSVIAALTGALNLLIFIVAVTVVSIPLAFVSVIGIAGFMAVGYRFLGINIQNNYRLREAECKVSSSEFKLIQGRNQITLENGEQSILRELSSGYSALGTSQLSIQTTEIRSEFMLGMIDQLLNTFLLIISSILIVKGNLTTGTYAAINVIIGTALEPIRSLASLVEQLQNSRLIYKSALDLYQPESNEVITTNNELNMDNPMLSLYKVTFKYSLYAEPIFENISIRIAHPKKECMIVRLSGSSGSGKSSLLNVISGLVKPNTGLVKVFGINTSNTSPQKIRHIIQYIDRNVIIVKGSVEMNTRLGTSASHSEYEEAVEMLGLSSQTIFSQQSKRYLADQSSISVGQSIMIALVRSVLIKPKLLLVDEALVSIPEQLHVGIIRGLRTLGISAIIVQHGNDGFISKLATIDLDRFKNESGEALEK